jgi:prepilin-type N-terminal cleavage/methylation domain-containing protein
MTRDRRREAFTLIEVLIVVVIMAVLAATIIPQFSSTTDDAKASQLIYNMHTLRSQIELYKIHHGGYPPLDDFETQMTTATTASGAAGGPYGPYFDEVPKNPFNDKANLVAGDGSAVPAGTDNGWQYDATSGGIWPGHEGWAP